VPAASINATPAGSYCADPRRDPPLATAIQAGFNNR